MAKNGQHWPKLKKIESLKPSKEAFCIKKPAQFKKSKYTKESFYQNQYLSVYNLFRVVIPLCGGNIDTTVLGRCLDRGLAADGRLVKFSVTVSDRPGGIAELAR